MLHNPKWDKPEPTLTGFVEWLKTKNPREEYRYGSIDGTCAVDQYLASCGIFHGTASNTSLWAEGRIAAKLNSFAYDAHNRDGRRTFGALLKCAEVALGNE